MSGWNIFLLLITTPRWYKVCGRLLVKSESDQTRLCNRYLMLHHSTPHNITQYESSQDNVSRWSDTTFCGLLFQWNIPLNIRYTTVLVYFKMTCSRKKEFKNWSIDTQ